MFALLRHRWRTGHQLYWVGDWGHRAHFECECGVNFRIWTFRRR